MTAVDVNGDGIHDLFGDMLFDTTDIERSCKANEVEMRSNAVEELVASWRDAGIARPGTDEEALRRRAEDFARRIPAPLADLYRLSNGSSAMDGSYMMFLPIEEWIAEAWPTHEGEMAEVIVFVDFLLGTYSFAFDINAGTVLRSQDRLPAVTVASTVGEFFELAAADDPRLHLDGE